MGVFGDMGLQDVVGLSISGLHQEAGTLGRCSRALFGRASCTQQAVVVSFESPVTTQFRVNRSAPQKYCVERFKWSTNRMK